MPGTPSPAETQVLTAKRTALQAGVAPLCLCPVFSCAYFGLDPGETPTEAAGSEVVTWFHEREEGEARTCLVDGMDGFVCVPRNLCVQYGRRAAREATAFVGARQDEMR